jgi:hypothetical protein
MLINLGVYWEELLIHTGSPVRQTFVRQKASIDTKRFEARALEFWSNG